MPSGDERRTMPPVSPPSGSEPPAAATGEQANIFKPVSVENRITGSYRGKHRRTPQFAPGSSYGAPETNQPPASFSDYAGPAFTTPPQPAAPPAPKPAADTADDPWVALGWKAPKTQYTEPIPNPIYGAANPKEPQGAQPSAFVQRPAFSQPPPTAPQLPHPVAREETYLPFPEPAKPKTKPLAPAKGATGGMKPLTGSHPFTPLAPSTPFPSMPADTLSSRRTGTLAPVDTGAYSARRAAPMELNTDAFSAARSAPLPPDTGAFSARRDSVPQPADTGAYSARTSHPYRQPERQPTDAYGRAPFAAGEEPPAPPPHSPEEPAPEEQPPRKGRALLQRAGSSWRMALLTACALAVLFAGIKVAQMVGSLMTSERQTEATREEYYAMAGVDPDQTASSVELLPAGQTYAPTATVATVATPTPTPRIDQNDPLIGVLDSGDSETVETAVPAVTTGKRTKLTRYPDNPLLSISDDFTTLIAQNADVVGQLTIDGLLDETVVQRNNTYYLTHNARGLFSSGGAIFVDEGVSLKKPPENLLLRGQATEAGKLFAPLAQYGENGAAFASAHSIVTCNTIYEKAQYVIFAVIHADSRTTSSDYFNYGGYLTFQNDDQMLSFVAGAREHSVYALDVAVQASDRLLTLAAVPEDDNTASWVLVCRMLRSGETADSIQTE